MKFELEIGIGITIGQWKNALKLVWRLFTIHSFKMTHIARSKKICCFTIEKYSNSILEIINSKFKLSKIKIILTKCNPPITGFDGKVSIVRILENK